MKRACPAISIDENVPSACRACLRWMQHAKTGTVAKDDAAKQAEAQSAANTDPAKDYRSGKSMNSGGTASAR
jgi:hypothetical protein